MTTVFIKADISDRKIAPLASERITEVCNWMNKHIEHWTAYRFSAEYYVIEFYGIDHVQDVLAFKLTFGDIVGDNNG